VGERNDASDVSWLSIQRPTTLSLIHASKINFWSTFFWDITLGLSGCRRFDPRILPTSEMMLCALAQMGDARWHKSFILGRARKCPSFSRGWWNLYYYTEVFAVGSTSWLGEGRIPSPRGGLRQVPISLWRKKLWSVRLPSLKPWTSLFIASRRFSRSTGVCRVWERRRGRAPVVGRLVAWPLYSPLTCAGRRMFGSCICIYDYVDSRG
jgi:hypothetical protein